MLMAFLDYIQTDGCMYIHRVLRCMHASLPTCLNIVLYLPHYLPTSLPTYFQFCNYIQAQTNRYTLSAQLFELKFTMCHMLYTYPNKLNTDLETNHVYMYICWCMYIHMICLLHALHNHATYVTYVRL